MTAKNKLLLVVRADTCSALGGVQAREWSGSGVGGGWDRDEWVREGVAR